MRFLSASAAAVSIFALAACSEAGPTSPVAESEIPQLAKLAEAVSFPAVPLRTVSQMAEGLDPMACVVAVRQAGSGYRERGRRIGQAYPDRAYRPFFFEVQSRDSTTVTYRVVCQIPDSEAAVEGMMTRVFSIPGREGATWEQYRRRAKRAFRFRTQSGSTTTAAVNVLSSLDPIDIEGIVVTVDRCPEEGTHYNEVTGNCDETWQDGGGGDGGFPDDPGTGGTGGGGDGGATIPNLGPMEWEGDTLKFVPQCPTQSDHQEQQAWCRTDALSGTQTRRAEVAIDDIASRGGFCLVIANRARLLLSNGRIRVFGEGVTEGGGWAMTDGIALRDTWFRFHSTVGTTDSGYLVNLAFAIAHESEHTLTGPGHVTEYPDYADPGHAALCSGLPRFPTSGSGGVL